MTGTDFDVIVVGGGPAGASVAGLLAGRGHSVLVLERAVFPRYHIGESLINGMFPVLDQLGVRETVDTSGFELKSGITLVWGQDLEQWNIEFSDLGSQTYSWHVDRADFDQLLLNRAASLGVEVRFAVEVAAPLVEDDRVVGVITAEGTRQHEIRARYVIDASGRQRTIVRHLTPRTWNAGLRNIATWGYWEDAGRLPGDLRHHTLIERCQDRIGWFWSIPLRDGRMSVGHVRPAGFDNDLGRRPDRWTERLGRAPLTTALLSQPAPGGALRTTKDWSYRSDRFAGPGWAAVGDAGAFIDPLLSTGVCLAMLEADPLAELIHRVLSNAMPERDALRTYDEGCRDFITIMTDYVEYFYDSRRDREDYEARAQSMVLEASKHTSYENFVRVLAGVMGQGRVIPL